LTDGEKMAILYSIHARIAIQPNGEPVGMRT
jgi:hypothetical protein